MKENFVAGFILAGSVLMLIAAIGVLRLPDVLCRAHAVAKAMTLGIFLMLFSLWLELDGEEAALKVLLAVFFQAVTIPVSSHLVGLLARQKNLPRWRGRRAGHRKSESGVGRST